MNETPAAHTHTQVISREAASEMEQKRELKKSNEGRRWEQGKKMTRLQTEWPAKLCHVNAGFSLQLQGLQEQPGPDRRRGERQSAVRRALAGGVTRPWRRPEAWVTVFHVSAFTSVGSRRREPPGCFYPTHQQRRLESRPVGLCRKFPALASSKRQEQDSFFTKILVLNAALAHCVRKIIEKVQNYKLHGWISSKSSRLTLQPFNLIPPPKKTICGSFNVTGGLRSRRSSSVTGGSSSGEVGRPGMRWKQ